MGIISSLIDGAFGLVSQGINWRQTQKENRRQRDFESYWNQKQQDNWQKEFNYTKYLNENQYQMQAKDQIAAGINPIAANGGAMQGFSANISPQTTRGETPQLDMSQIANAISQYAEQKFQAKENEKNRESAEKIAEINAEASKYAADSSAGSSIYGSDTQAAIAAEERRHREKENKLQRTHEKEIHNLDNKSREQIADWTMQTQAALQNAAQAWEDSNDHRIAQEAFERMMRNVQLDYEAQNYLAKQQVTLRTATGETRTMSIQDAIDYCLYDQAMYEGSAGVRALNELRETARSIGNLFSTDRGSLYNRERTETTRRRSRGYSR